MEEQQQTPDPNSYPNKRPKPDPTTPTPPSSIKGKAPLTPITPITPSLSDDDDEIPTTPPPQNCGICLSEEGKTVRGLIDSCSHYFCFLCMIEWSKIESRCPLCRGRFSTIRRMRKDGSFVGDGAVRVPVRDQIYDPFGEPVDPYGHAKCSVCNGTKDENLLLLCDMCDSALHTYCVGLGFTVPEGDWYCHDCSLLRDEQHQQESDMEDDKESPVGKQEEMQDGSEDQVPFPMGPVSIFDIVREDSPEPHSHAGTDRLRRLVSRPTKFSSTAVVSGQSSNRSSGKLPKAEGDSCSQADVRDSSARTLRNCRDVQMRIKVLRENWGGFRSGSLSFSSNFLGSAGRQNLKSGTSAEGIFQLQSASSSSRSSQPKGQSKVCDGKQNQGSYNVERAWKLMNKAKSMQQVHEPKSVSKTSVKKVEGLKVDDGISKCIPSGRRDHVSSGLRMQKQAKEVSGRKVMRSENIGSVTTSAPHNKHQNSGVFRSSGALGVQTPVRADTCHNRTCLVAPRDLSGGKFVVCTDATTLLCGPNDLSCSNIQRRKMSMSPSNRAENINICESHHAVQSSSKSNISHERAVLASAASTGQCLSNISTEHHCSIPSIAPCENMPNGTDVSCVKSDGKETPSDPRKNGTNITSKATRDDEAKGEILSLVKLNMKLLSKGKQLGHDVFKEIARLSTHTVLAACGLEHRNIVGSVPSLVCCHGNQIQQKHRCSIVPRSCRECFYAFVKDTVSSILSEKLECAGVAC